MKEIIGTPEWEQRVGFSHAQRTSKLGKHLPILHSFFGLDWLKPVMNKEETTAPLEGSDKCK